MCFIFHRYNACHDMLDLAQGQSSHYLEHPVNAFDFIRHLYWGWKNINQSVLKNRAWFCENIGGLIWTNTLTVLGKALNNYW